MWSNSRCCVGSFDTVDLYLEFDFEGTGALRDVSISLNVNNVLNQDPPFYGRIPAIRKARPSDGWSSSASASGSDRRL